MHDFVTNIDGLERHDCIFSPYSDCGIFGHFFMGDPRFNDHMTYIGSKIGEIYSEYLTEQEVTRAKYKIYNELLSVQSASDQMQQYGP
jgi:hypothetical protein